MNRQTLLQRIAEKLIDHIDPAAMLPRLAWHYGEPFADPSAVPTLAVCELARAILARPAATHGTATFEESALRDCLVASCLRGRGSGAFFEDADRPRRIERRI